MGVKAGQLGFTVSGIKEIIHGYSKAKNTPIQKCLSYEHSKGFISQMNK